jgi:hypothetical protein
MAARDFNQRKREIQGFEQLTVVSKKDIGACITLLMEPYAHYVQPRTLTLVQLESLPCADAETRNM